MFYVAFRTQRYGIEYEYEYHFIEHEYDKRQNIATSKVRSRGSRRIKYNDTVGL